MSKVLLFLFVAGVLCLAIFPATALMQSRPEDFHVEIFDPIAQSRQAQSPDLGIELFDPKSQTKALAGVTLFDPKDPQSSANLIKEQAAVQPEVSSSLLVSQVYTRGGEAGATYNGDFVELFNRGTTALDIKGYSIIVDTFEGSTETSVGITFNQSFSVPPGMHILFSFLGNGSNGQALPSGHFPVTNIGLGSTSGQIVILPPGQGIPSGCPVGSGTIIDFYGYGTTACFEGSPSSVPTSNQSRMRVNANCTDTDNNLSDFASVTPN